MRTSGDRWSELRSPEAAQAAAARLRQMNETPSEQHANRRWLALLAPNAGERVLDVGAGIGEMSVGLAQRVGAQGTVVALDRSPALLQQTRALADQTHCSGTVIIASGDACGLPYASGRFDAVFCRRLLLHLPEPEQALAEMRRVLRPGGRLLCVETDWETLAVHPGDPKLTRQIRQANVARQVDGRIGGRLVPLLRSAGMRAVSAVPLVTLDVTGDWLPFLRSRLEVAAAAGVPEHALSAWWRQIEAAARTGCYQFSFTQFGVFGTAGHTQGAAGR